MEYIVEALQLAAADLVKIELAVKNVGVDIPTSPFPVLASDQIEVAAMYATDLWDRIQTWNACLLAKEAHLEPPNSDRIVARVVGRQVHLWYEATKLMYMDLGIRRADEAMIELYKEVCLSMSRGNRRATAFWNGRMKGHPIAGFDEEWSC